MGDSIGGEHVPGLPQSLYAYDRGHVRLRIKTISK